MSRRPFNDRRELVVKISLLGVLFVLVVLSFVGTFLVDMDLRDASSAISSLNVSVSSLQDQVHVLNYSLRVVSRDLLVTNGIPSDLTNCVFSPIVNGTAIITLPFSTRPMEMPQMEIYIDKNGQYAANCEKKVS